MTVETCAALVERADPDRFSATMAAPVAARAVLWPLYAFNIEAARAPWASAEPMIAEMRLQWWRDALDDIAAGVLRPHEVMAPLAAVIAQAKLPIAVLDGILAARRWDIYRDAHEDRAALDGYLEDTGGALMWLAAKALGAPDHAEAGVRAAGYAMALAGYLRAVPELEARVRVPLLDGRPAAVAALAQDGLEKLRLARAARLPVVVRPALLAGWQTAGLLRLAVAEPARVADGALALPEFRKRGGLLWAAMTGRI